ncbi:MAG: TetR/AcrR family transcriptional regulator [Clostridia bacterium]|nr:TetR/AcrR family transcriptional regulator [Clostridia bacterium]
MRTSNQQSREKFIVAAISEMQQHGISDFSIRSVAEKCGVSSGAPYKHFKNKNELILESIKYINTKWGEIQQKVIEECGDDPRKKLVEISIAYVKFLCANPAFQSVLMLNDNSLSPEQLAQKAKISELTEKIISEYCSSVGMNDADRKRKTYAVRSFIFGAAFMINSGFFCDDEENISLVRYCIEREFDLK